MRVLHVCNIATLEGGAEKSIDLIRASLTERGHECAFLATDRLNEGVRVGDDGVLATHLVAAPTGRLRPFKRLWHRPAARAARDVLAEFRPDVVHLHTIGEFSPALLAQVEHLPRLLTVHGAEDWIGSMLFWQFPSASTGTLTPLDRLKLEITKRVYRPWWLRRIRRLPLIVTPSEYYARQIRAEVPNGRVEVLRNGIPLPSSTPLRRHNRAVFVGRVHEGKGLVTLMDAMDRVAARNDHTELVVVGGGPHLDLAQRRAAAHPGRVRVTGCVTREQLVEEMQEATVILVPSIWLENFPTVVLEAMGYGRPVIASRVGGLPELVEDGVNGLLVEPGDPEALASAIERVTSDPAEADRMGEASSARAGDFDVDLFVDRLEQIYGELIAQHRG